MEYHIPPTTLRVALHTNPAVNSKIREKTINELRSVQDTDLDVINHRLRMLEEEWDMERVLETSVSAIAAAGTLLGFFRSRKWFLLSGAAGAYMLLHAIKGWCPLVPLFRSQGVRTGDEIANERTVLKMMRKDFEHPPQDVRDMLRIAEQ